MSVRRGCCVDTHAHLNHPDYDTDRVECLARAREAGLVAVVNIGYDLASSQGAITLALTEHDCFAAVGIHPHDARTADASALSKIGAWLERDKVVALGEIGLDFFRDLSPRDVQRDCFRAQLALARERNVPVILHNREAHEEMLEILRTEGLPSAGGVMHCFPGDIEMARECVRLGLHVGVNGVVTFRNAGALQEAVRAVPLDRLLVETDCPYLAPAPKRGKRNEPAYLPYVVEGLAAALERAPEKVAEATTENARRLFGLL